MQTESQQTSSEPQTKPNGLSLEEVSQILGLKEINLYKAGRMIDEQTATIQQQARRIQALEEENASLKTQLQPSDKRVVNIGEGKTA